MVNYIKEYVRKKQLRGKKNTNVFSIPNLAGIRSAGFMFKLEGSHDRESLAAVMEAFRAQGIPFRGIVVECSGSFKKKADKEHFRKVFCPDNGITFIGKESLSWTGVPKSPLVKKFFGQEFDLFVCFNDNYNFTLEYLSYEVKARCMTGMINNPLMPHTLVIDGGKKPLSHREYLEQVFHYLAFINKK